MGEVYITFTAGPKDYINTYCNQHYVNIPVTNITKNEYIYPVSSGDMSQFIMTTGHKYTIHVTSFQQIGNSPSYANAGYSDFYYPDGTPRYSNSVNYCDDDLFNEKYLYWLFYSVNLSNIAKVVSTTNWKPTINDDQSLAAVNIRTTNEGENENSYQNVYFPYIGDSTNDQFTMTIIPTDGNNIFATRITGTVWENAVKSINSGVNIYTYGFQTMKFTLKIVVEKIVE